MYWIGLRKEFGCFVRISSFNPISSLRFKASFYTFEEKSVSVSQLRVTFYEAIPHSSKERLEEIMIYADLSLEKHLEESVTLCHYR